MLDSAQRKLLAERVLAAFAAHVPLHHKLVIRVQDDGDETTVVLENPIDLLTIDLTLPLLVELSKVFGTDKFYINSSYSERYEELNCEITVCKDLNQMPRPEPWKTWKLDPIAESAMGDLWVESVFRPFDVKAPPAAETDPTPES